MSGRCEHAEKEEERGRRRPQHSVSCVQRGVVRGTDGRHVPEARPARHVHHVCEWRRRRRRRPVWRLPPRCVPLPRRTERRCSDDPYPYPPPAAGEVFVPTFPSGSPFVTSVGATNTLNDAAASFSSGGFSNMCGQPAAGRRGLPLCPASVRAAPLPPIPQVRRAALPDRAHCELPQEHDRRTRDKALQPDGPRLPRRFYHWRVFLDLLPGARGWRGVRSSLEWGLSAAFTLGPRSQPTGLPSSCWCTPCCSGPRRARRRHVLRRAHLHGRRVASQRRAPRGGQGPARLPQPGAACWCCGARPQMR